MRGFLRPLVLIVTLVLTTAPRLTAQDGPEPSEAEVAFFRELKRAALAGDRAWITGHVCYPVRAVVEGRTRMIANAAELDAAYAQVLTLEAVNAIRRQIPEALVRTRYGVMVGDGELWLGVDPAADEGAPAKVCIIAFGNAG